MCGSLAMKNISRWSVAGCLVSGDGPEPTTKPPLFPCSFFFALKKKTERNKDRNKNRRKKKCPSSTPRAKSRLCL